MGATLKVHHIWCSPGEAHQDVATGSSQGVFVPLAGASFL